MNYEQYHNFNNNNIKIVRKNLIKKFWVKPLFKLLLDEELSTTSNSIQINNLNFKDGNNLLDVLKNSMEFGNMNRIIRTIFND